jgi:hypothetical protein
VIHLTDISEKIVLGFTRDGAAAGSASLEPLLEILCTIAYDFDF